MSKGIREAPTKAVMNELAHDSGDSPDAAYGKGQPHCGVGEGWLVAQGGDRRWTRQ